ncbi:TetR/AcrR family transcriptional regulator [Microvirga puerhi]|uniref:TetR/AcrR family transcriptional regulator n=1 Tax=Microvirga puerhi TaxID=2876078 RepID=A0ABS7VWE9_9HYPH|nr:TetR/AcrR family transcriptional regulator [Microvirga puerhi]MBZ6079297.1 TetR/AcrR family transcriptional regulator [Microvirga puerhi]
MNKTHSARSTREPETISSQEKTSEWPSALRARDAKLATNPRRELVREQLIDIAAELFDRKGYAQTSINDIAKALGLGRSAVYHYFRNKEEILAALVEAEALTPSNLLRELIEETGLSATERLRRAVVDGIVRRLSSGARFILLSRLETQIPEELGPLYNLGRRHIYDFYVRCISEGIANGEFREVDPKIAAFAVIGMANWTSRWYSPSGPKTPVEIADVIADLALQGLKSTNNQPYDPEEVRRRIDGLRQQIDVLENLLK